MSSKNPFKVGDRVRRLNYPHGASVIGKVYTVLGVRDDNISIVEDEARGFDYYHGNFILEVRPADKSIVFVRNDESKLWARREFHSYDNNIIICKTPDSDNEFDIWNFIREVIE